MSFWLEDCHVFAKIPGVQLPRQARKLEKAIIPSANGWGQPDADMPVKLCKIYGIEKNVVVLPIWRLQPKK